MFIRRPFATKASGNGELVSRAAKIERPLGTRALHGIVMLLGQNIGSRVVTFVSQLMLAWFLMPADFGVIGLAYVITGLVSSIQSFGVDDVLLQRKTTFRFWAEQAFWLSLGLSALAACLVLVAAPFAAVIFKSKELVGILAILASSMPLAALCTVPNTVLRAEMRFGTIAAYGAFENLGIQALTVLLAWRGLGAFSFVIPLPIFYALRARVFWYLAPFPANRLRRKNSWKLLLGNSAALFGGRVINSAIGQGDYFILGLLYSHSVVGDYYFAFRLAAQPLWTLAGNFTGVIYPVLVQLKSDAVRQRDAALKAASLLSYAAIFFGFLQAGIARPLIADFFGTKWLPAIPLIELLSIGLAFDAVSWVAGSLMGARGQFVRSFGYIAILSPVFFVLVTIGALADAAKGVALAVCAFYVLTQPVYTYFVFRSADVKLFKIVALYLKPAIFAAIAVGLGVWLAALPAISHGKLLQVIVTCGASCVLYIGLVRIGAPLIFRDAVDRIFKRVKF